VVARLHEEHPAADATPARHIAVGIDGPADAPLRWASREARARGCTLRIVDLRCRPHALTADPCPDPRETLLVEAAGAELLVVGGAGAGDGHRALLASVPPNASRGGPCPIVVVRDERPTVGRIVVGVDSSNAASAALDWAIDEANRNGAEIVVVHAWQRRGPADRSVRLGDLRRAEAAGLVDVAVRYCRERTMQTVRGDAPVGDPASVLVAASEGADLVVVGSRGRSGFRTALFGSVALDLADGARCPVVVIHPRLRRPPAA